MKVIAIRYKKYFCPDKNLLEKISVQKKTA